MSGVAVASWKITENIDNGSKFNPSESDLICNWHASHILREDKNSK